MVSQRLSQEGGLTTILVRQMDFPLDQALWRETDSSRIMQDSWETGGYPEPQH